jgi:hypothetical protein
MDRSVRFNFFNADPFVIARAFVENRTVVTMEKLKANAAKIPNKKGKPKPADSLLKTSKKRDIGLTEKELGKVTGGGGTRAGTKPYLKISSFDEA